MTDQSRILAAAEALANSLDRFLRDRGSQAELSTKLLEFRAAQALADEELTAMLEKMAEEQDLH